MAERSKVVRAKNHRWSGIALRAYKSEGAHFRDVSRQTLLGEADEDAGLQSVLRYFEIAPGGYSTLERHRHPHMVVIVRGRGHVILGDRVEAVNIMDCVYVAPNTFHQFHADMDETFGFLCIVDRERDHPALPDAQDISELRLIPAVAERMKI